MDQVYLGIDWGGTRIKLGLVNSGQCLIKRDSYEASPRQEIEAVVEGLMTKVARMLADADGSLLGIGLGLTGAVNPDLGVVLLPGKIRGLENFPIVPRFRERFGVPVTADNDGKVALVAERYIGAARDVDWATVITIGTGIGSGVLLGGQIPDDPHLMFGTQLGHLVMHADNDQLCLTGCRGTGEMSCSATALVLAVRSGLQRGIPSLLSDRYAEDPRQIDFKTIIEEGVEKDDRLCLHELERWTRNLGWLVVNAVHAYSPQVVILSGGATLAAPHYLPQVQAQVDEHIFRNPRGTRVPIVISRIQEHAGVVGAALMCHHRKKNAAQTRPKENLS